MRSRTGGVGLWSGKDNIPAEIKISILKACMLFVAWRIAYFFILEPADFPDKQLIDLVLHGTRRLLLLFYDKVTIDADTLVINGISALTVYKQCNGLDMIVTYLAFLFCLPISRQRFLLFVIAGPCLIYVLNLLRCLLLASLFYAGFHPHSFTHHQVFDLVAYSAVFVMWRWCISNNY